MSDFNEIKQQVAPANYKHPTALVTPKMLEAAEAKLKELGLERAIYRRLAKPTDISVVNTIFVDRGARFTDVFNTLKQDLTVNPKQFAKAEEIEFDDFASIMLPEAASLEVLLENRHTNFMSLITSQDYDAPPLFSWDNPISWTYKDDMTDSLKEKVKSAGGKVDGELRISLEWFNYDDLDLHVIEPGGHEIMYNSRSSITGNGGLDVDMNAGISTSRNAVENVIFFDKKKMIDGEYTVNVHNFRKQESVDVGFNVEIECQGEILTFGQTTAVTSKDTVLAAMFMYSKDRGVYDVQSSISGENFVAPSKEVWNLNTNKFQRVGILLKSPNHWGEQQKGNLHTFFILDGCKNPTQPRGIFNEFLRPELQEHRKVFELLGSKLKVPESVVQCSGLGFSSTQRADIICRVMGEQTRTFKVKF